MPDDFEARSTLQATVKINACHEGEVNNITQEKMGDYIKQGVTELIRDEAGEDDVPVTVSVYFTKFVYGDNTDELRSEIRERLQTQSAEQLATLLETLNNG